MEHKRMVPFMGHGGQYMHWPWHTQVPVPVTKWVRDAKGPALS
jgi:hypothetical protein